MQRWRVLTFTAGLLTLTLLFGLVHVTCAQITPGSDPQPLTPPCTPGTNCPMSGGNPGIEPPPAGGAFAAISRGQFSYSKTDMVVPAPMPIVISRTYRSRDKDSNGNYLNRAFGVGTRFNYGIILYSNSEVANGTYTDAEVAMPDGSQIQCVNQGPTSPYTAVNFHCGSQPTGIWFGAHLVWNGTTSQWNLTRKDGTVYAFAYGGTLQSITDRYKNSVVITRNTNLPQCTNPGMKVESFINGATTGRWVAVCFDGVVSWTITKVVDGSGTYKVVYGYDSTGKMLTYVQYPNYKPYTQTKYTWTSSPQMSSIATYIDSITPEL